MGKRYEKADADVMNLIRKVTLEHHGKLDQYGVTVSAVLVYSAINAATGEPKGPALKVHGVPAAAKVKVTSLEQRVRGMADAQITIDGNLWEDMGDPQREALIDHELEHLVQVLDKDDKPDTDDIGRPLLKCKPHDWELGGFANVVERHGDLAIEHECMRATLKNYGPLFSWAADKRAVG